MGSAVGVMEKKYRVQLTGGEQEELKGLVTKGRGGGIPADSRPHLVALRRESGGRSPA